VSKLWLCGRRIGAGESALARARGAKKIGRDSKNLSLPRASMRVRTKFSENIY
jgi:hypothetical protein